MDKREPDLSREFPENNADINPGVDPDINELEESMDTATVLDHIRKFLEEHPDLKPTEGFALSEPFEEIINGEIVYYVCWIDSNGQNARGGCSYCVMPNGTVLLPGGGSAEPESLESVYARWQAEQ